jgi:hypothetical protein
MLIWVKSILLRRSFFCEVFSAQSNDAVVKHDGFGYLDCPTANFVPVAPLLPVVVWNSMKLANGFYLLARCMGASNCLAALTRRFNTR